LTGRIGRNRAVSQRWLNAPKGFAQPSLASISRSRKCRMPSSVHPQRPSSGPSIRFAPTVVPVSHSGSTAVEKSGITAGAYSAHSWIRPLCPSTPGGYISSCPKGQCEPPDRPDERSTGRAQEPGSRAARPASEASGRRDGTPDLFGAATSRPAGFPQFLRALSCARADADVFAGGRRDRNRAPASGGSGRRSGRNGDRREGDQGRSCRAS
jgi:hypothetical protein